MTSISSSSNSVSIRHFPHRRTGESAGGGNRGKLGRFSEARVRYTRVGTREKRRGTSDRRRVTQRLRGGIMRVPLLLAEHHVPFETLHHAPAFTAQRRAHFLRIPGRQLVKSVLL